MANTIQEQGPATYTLMRARVEAVRARDAAAKEDGFGEPLANDAGPDTATILRGLTGKAADETLLAGTAPPVVFRPTAADVENDGDRGPRLHKTRAAAQADRANATLDCVLDLHDPGGERLRVEVDDRDGRSYLTVGEPDVERPFELGPQDATKIIGALSETPRPWLSGKHVQQAAAPVKTASPRVLTDADRDDADRTMLRARCDDLANELPPHHVRVLSRMLGELPPGKLLQHLEAITADAVEGAGAPNNYRASGWEEQARAALLDAWRAYERIMLRPDEPHTPRRTVHDYTSGAVAAEHAKDGAK